MEHKGGMLGSGWRSAAEWPTSGDNRQVGEDERSEERDEE